MNVVLQTPTQLIVHDGVLKTVIGGIVFAGFGGGAITLWLVDPKGWTGNGGPWLLYLVGAVFIAVGIVLFALSADRRYVIDRAAGTARLTVQRLAHRTSSEYRLGDLKDVVLERSKGGPSQSNPCYRVVFLTKAGGRVPWTPYWTNDQVAFGACASAVRAFCGWAGRQAGVPAAGVNVPTLPPTWGGVSGHPVATNWGCAGALLAIFVAVGLGIFGAEVYRIATWQPVSARILSTDIRSIRGDRSTTYAPVVSYQYSFGGAQYTSNGVLPITVSAGVGWAENLRDRFRPGEIVTAYVNPNHPSSAFLLHQVSLMPLLFVVIPLAMAMLLAWIVRVQRRQLAAVDMFPVPVVEA